MIVVVGQGEERSVLAIARAAAAAGGTVELVARITDDDRGDALIHGLATAGVGHVATLRQPPGTSEPVLDAADLDLALRYLTDVTTLVMASAGDDASRSVAIEAVGWAQAHLIVVIEPRGATPDGLPDAAIVLGAPQADPDGVFSALVGTLAARLDAGVEPATAFREATAGGPGWTSVGDDR